jgi:8-oxo-dGTP pyrophosphatase MutT (NUDIX family)
MLVTSSTSAPAAPLRLAACIIVDVEGRLLLLHRYTSRYNHWELPGGKVETDEATASAAARKVREELGVTAIVGALLGCQVFAEDGQEMVYTWFRARIVRGVPRVQEPHRHDTCRYFSIDQMQAMRAELSSAAVHFLDRLQEGEIVM